MEKRLPTTSRRRLCLDALESRQLLTGGLIPGGMQPVPALVAELGTHGAGRVPGPGMGLSTEMHETSLMVSSLSFSGYPGIIPSAASLWARVDGPREQTFVVWQAAAPGAESMLASAAPLVQKGTPAPMMFASSGAATHWTYQGDTTLSGANGGTLPVGPPPFRPAYDLMKARGMEFMGGRDGMLPPPALVAPESPSAVSPSLSTASAMFPEGLAAPLLLVVSPGGSFRSLPLPGLPDFMVPAGMLAGVTSTHGEMFGNFASIDAALAGLPAEKGFSHWSDAAVTVREAGLTLPASRSDGEAVPVVDAAVLARLDPDRPIQQDVLSIPQSAGLITSAIPFDRAALERAVDQFFAQIEEGLGMAPAPEQGAVRVLPLGLALLGTATAAEFARRRLRTRGSGWSSAAKDVPLGSEELLGFPELPGSWSTRLT